MNGVQLPFLTVGWAGVDVGALLYLYAATGVYVCIAYWWSTSEEERRRAGLWMMVGYALTVLMWWAVVMAIADDAQKHAKQRLAENDSERRKLACLKMRRLKKEITTLEK